MVDLIVSDAEDEIEPAEKIDHGPLPALVGYTIRKAYNQLFQSWNEMFGELGLAFGQYSILLLISKNPGISQGNLAAAAGIERSSIVPTTERLSRLGWIRRTRRRTNRRTYSLRTTPAGEAVLKQAVPILSAHELRLIRNLDPKERVQLMRLLEKLIGNDSSSDGTDN